MNTAIDIPRVREIRSSEPPTGIAHAPNFMKGVTRLGAAVPILADIEAPISNVNLGLSGTAVH